MSRPKSLSQPPMRKLRPFLLMKAVETAAYGNAWKNQTAIFPPVPTGLGKLGAHSTPSFPQFPQLLRLDRRSGDSFQRKATPPFICWGGCGKLFAKNAPSFPQPQKLEMKNTTTSKPKRVFTRSPSRYSCARGPEKLLL